MVDCNLMKRLENCVHLRVEHNFSKNDSLVFEFSKSKGHKGGEEHAGPWNVYSNPLDPFKFPLLSLAHYLLKFANVLKTTVSFFNGNSQYERYSNIFLNLVKEL